MPNALLAIIVDMADKPAPASFSPFFILLAIIVALWAFGGGTNLNNSGDGGANGNSNYKAPANLKGIENEIIRIGDETKELQKEVERKNLIGPLSQLYEKITLDSGNATSDKVDQEYLQIYVSNDAPINTLLSGMALSSGMTGRGAVIPWGLYQVAPNKKNVSEPIKVNPGDTIYVSSGKSPLGFSFRVNKCLGYLSEIQEFTPYLSTDCPAPKDERPPHVELQYREACLDYIDNLSSCQRPNLDQETAAEIGPTCTNFVLSKFNYNSCFVNHQYDPGFYEPEWRVYLSLPVEIWDSSHEFIKLLDLNRKTVDFIEY